VLNTVYGLVGLVVMAGVGLFALIRGGAAERYAMAVTALGWVASLAVQAASGVKDPLLGLLGIDVMAFLALVGLVWRSKRLWVVAAVACQSLATGVDLVRLVSPHMRGWGYLTALAVAGYGLLAAIGFGTATAKRPGSAGAV
jgi:hypothetical protein